MERYGSKTVEFGGRRVSGKRVVPQLVWQLLTEGECELPSGRKIEVNGAGWFEVAKWVYAQVDGPPPKDVNLGGQADNPLLIEVVWDESGLDDGEIADAASRTSGGQGE